MSSTLTNIQLGTSVSTLDGLSVINADQLYVNGENVNPASPNIPIQPTTSNFVHPIVVTTSFGPQTASVLNVDGNTYLGYNPSLRILYTDKLTIGSQIIANGISAGTPLSTTYLALDASNRFITTAVPATSLVSITQIAGGYASPLYFCFLTSTASGAQVIYSDDLSPITYNTNNKYLTIKNLTATSGTWTNSGGTTSSQTLTCASFTASSSASLPPFCSFPTLPSVGTPAYFLAVDSANQVVIATGISAQPTITATNTNAIYYLTFAPNATTTASSPLYVDAGASLTYNASSNTLDVPIASIPNLTANSSFTANGSNSIAGYAPLNSPGLTGVPTCPTGFAGVSSNQIASQEFVIDSLPSLAGYAPLASPTFTGVPSGPTALAGTNTTQLATTQFVTTAVGGLSGYITKTGTNTGINTILRLNGTSSEFVVQSSTSSPLLSVRQSASPYVSADSLYIINTLETQGTTTLQGATTINNTLNVSGTIGISNPAFLQMLNNNFTAYNYTIGSNGTAGANTWITLRSPAYGASIVPLATIACNTTINGATTIVNTFEVTNAFEASVGACYVKSQYLHLYNASNPYLNVSPFGSGGNFFGQATNAGSFLTDAGTGDLIIGSRTGNIRLAGGAQYGRTNLFITNNGVGCQASSMFDFTSAGGWTDSNSLYMTANGLGGNSAGVGIGHNTSLDSGLLCSIAPNVIWKPMTYKAFEHRFTVGNISLPMVTINSVGMGLYQSGYITNNQGAINAGLAGTDIGDLILYGSGSTQMIRLFTGANMRMTANNTRVQVLGVEHVVNTTSYGQYRMISDFGGYGAFWRNDNANFYFLKTNYGDPYGVWDGTRPLRIELSTGKMFSENGYQALGGLSCDSFTAGINNGSHVALNGGNFFYMVGSGNQPTGCYLPQGFNLYKVYVSTTGNQFGTNDQWWGEAVVRYNNTSYNCSVTTTAGNNVQISGDANGHIYCYCPGGGGLFYAWITWQRVI